LATRFTAAAAAIGLVGAALAAPAGSARAVAVPGGPIPFSVADPAIAPRPVLTVSIGGASLRLLLDTGSTGIRVAADKVPAQAARVTGRAAPHAVASHAVGPQAASAAAMAPAISAPKLTAPHPAPAESAPASAPKKPQHHLPFHRIAAKAARLPDTGVPMSAALGAVTALTALLAGVGTVVAARRRGDRQV